MSIEDSLKWKNDYRNSNKRTIQENISLYFSLWNVYRAKTLVEAYPIINEINESLVEDLIYKTK